jgi:hypothetical protein
LGCGNTVQVNRLENSSRSWLKEIFELRASSSSVTNFRGVSMFQVVFIRILLLMRQEKFRLGGGGGWESSCGGGGKIRVFGDLRNEGERKNNDNNYKSNKENNKENILLSSGKVITFVSGRELESESGNNKREINKSKSVGSLFKNKLRVIVSNLTLTIGI